MSIPIPIPQFAVPREEKVEELSSFGQDLISKLTLECLMNDKQYSKYISRNNIASQKDKKFYKKRIYDLTKKYYTMKKFKYRIRMLFIRLRYLPKPALNISRFLIKPIYYKRNIRN